MYQTETLLSRRLCVRYPAGRGRMVLRTALDWETDVEPVQVSEDGQACTFALEARRPFLYFKPCLREGGGALHWAVGPDMLLLMTGEGTGDVYPYFEGAQGGSFSPVVERDSALLGRKHLLRVYLPPGYA
jgi:hypothetical protein